ncbi:MAG TPA: transketolase [Chloroflexota bacterium]|nr:transketolase [Chloroflexota bacterium]
MQTAVDEELLALRKTAREVRRLIIQAVNHSKAGHLGGPLSAADVLTVLYFKILRIDPERPHWPDRDRFILSKGHSAIGLYSVLALRGFFPVDELMTFDQINSRLQGHPDMTKLPGIDMSSGSLGQGLSPGVGMALGAKLLDKDFHTWVMLGDGEIQEGQIWEAALVAEHYNLDNLTAILDYNGLQQYGWTASLANGKRQPRISIDNPRQRWEVWGWHVLEMDGHNVGNILETCRKARTMKGKPTLIISHSIKGKGVSFMENDYNWHSKVLTEAEFAQAMADLARPVEGE